MKRLQVRALFLSCLVFFAAGAALAQSGDKATLNSVKQKLQEGKQVFGATIQTSDPGVYCTVANAGWDFLWIEMQHSTLTYQEVANMIRGCKGSAAVPFVRVPDATEGDIQKATDMGALGIIVPMVDTVEKIQNAVKFAKYPPIGKRSQGGGQYGELYGRGYRQTANDNIMIVAMIENLEGGAIADQIASVPGVDVVFVASSDLSSFSGKKQGDPAYEAMVTKIHDATLKANRKLAGPIAWRNRPDFKFFQGPSESGLARTGSESVLGIGKERPPQGSGVAPMEGQER